jgi:hypothetical protein
MNRNVSYLVIGALAVVAVVFGYQLYQERQKTTGVEISVGDRGISIGKKQSGIFLMAPSKGGTPGKPIKRFDVALPNF